MSKFTIDQIKELVEVISKDFRLLHGSPTLSTIEEPDTKGVVNSKKNIILILAPFENDGEDVEVAKKGLGFSIARNLGITDNPNDFN